MIIGALVRMHIGSSAVSYCWLREKYSICKLTRRVMKPKIAITIKAMTNPPTAVGGDLLYVLNVSGSMLSSRGLLFKLVVRSRGGFDYCKVLNYTTFEYSSFLR